MVSRSLIIFVVLSLEILQLAVAFNIRDDNGAANKEESANSTEAVDASGGDLDDRLNLNFNLAQAQGFGRFGGHSQSNSLSYGVNAGIRRPNGHYQNLFSDSRSQSNGYSSGPGAPLTFANTGSRVMPGHAGGTAAAGLIGGRGSSFATSQNQNIEIPLDNRGTVLFSNLQERNATTVDSKPDKEEPATIVFS